MPSSGGYVFTVVSLSAYIRFVYFVSVCFCTNMSAIHYVQSALQAHFFTPTIYDYDEAVPVYREYTQRAAIWLVSTQYDYCDRGCGEMHICVLSGFF